MWVHCPTCRRGYDDSVAWTTCPHGPLAFPSDDYCCRCDTIKSLRGPCAHQQHGAQPINLRAQGLYQELSALRVRFGLLLSISISMGILPPTIEHQLTNAIARFCDACDALKDCDLILDAARDRKDQKYTYIPSL